MTQERRRYKRYNSTLALTITLEDETHIKAVAQTQNVSREGLKFTTNTHIPIASTLRLEIKADDGSETFHATAKVVWSQKVEKSQYDNEYGLKFLSIDPIEKFHLLDKTIKQIINEEEE